jgi:hypothetical protein
MASKERKAIKRLKKRLKQLTKRVDQIDETLAGKQRDAPSGVVRSTPAFSEQDVENADELGEEAEEIADLLEKTK